MSHHHSCAFCLVCWMTDNVVDWSDVCCHNFNLLESSRAGTNESVRTHFQVHLCCVHLCVAGQSIFYRRLRPWLVVLGVLCEGWYQKHHTCCMYLVFHFGATVRLLGLTLTIDTHFIPDRCDTAMLDDECSTSGRFYLLKRWEHCHNRLFCWFSVTFWDFKNPSFVRCFALSSRVDLLQSPLPSVYLYAFTVIHVIQSEVITLYAPQPTIRLSGLDIVILHCAITVLCLLGNEICIACLGLP